MKSPVFGAKAGNIKMRGKKTKLLSCLCCGVIDCRWEQRFKEAKKEIENEAKTNRART